MVQVSLAAIGNNREAAAATATADLSGFSDCHADGGQDDQVPPFCEVVLEGGLQGVFVRDDLVRFLS